jgi:tRNA threonylcarbamoyladenosine biosynthesis protein TsaB
VPPLATSLVTSSAVPAVSALPSSADAVAAARLLAIDASTERLCLALQIGDQVHTVDADGGAQASAQALPLVLALLRDAGVVLASLDAVAFAHGPGAFTGLRTACAVAQGLAFGAGLPVLAVDSLLIVAEQARAAGAAMGEPLRMAGWVAMDARMDEVYAGRYEPDGQAWAVRQPPALYDLPALAACWQSQPPRWVAGSALAAFGARLPLPSDCRRIDTDTGRAAALMRVAQAAWRSGAAVAPEDALPLYLRDKVALTTAERAAAAAPREASR